MQPESGPSTISTSALLRRALIVDAAASGVTGVILTIGADPLANVLGLSSVLLRVAGLICLVWAAFNAFLGSRPRVPRPLSWVVVEGNLLWVAASILLLAAGWVTPTALGQAVVLLVALAVAVLAVVQWLGLQRTGPTLSQELSR